MCTVYIVHCIVHESVKNSITERILCGSKAFKPFSFVWIHVSRIRNCSQHSAFHIISQTLQIRYISCPNVQWSVCCCTRTIFIIIKFTVAYCSNHRISNELLVYESTHRIHFTKHRIGLCIFAHSFRWKM